jgi:hypothetical protein
MISSFLQKITTYRANAIIHYASIFHVNLPLFLSSPIRPFTINKLFPLQKPKSFLPYNLDQYIIFGIVYIPPENTVYSSQDAFIEIGNEYNNFSINSKYIYLIGDFNGRTADAFSKAEHDIDISSGQCTSE